jgi:uncharacterized protein (TIGR03435 family)
VIFGRTAAEPVRDIENVPDWGKDFYDITVKPPAGMDRTALPAMWQAMLADRLKLKAHVEYREKDGYALVLARTDGQLGPNLKPSALDCTLRVQTTTPQPPPHQPTTFPAREDSAKRCGMQAGGDYIVSGGMATERLAQLASGWVGGAPVNDRTGLKRFYCAKARREMRATNPKTRLSRHKTESGRVGKRTAPVVCPRCGTPIVDGQQAMAVFPLNLTRPDEHPVLSKPLTISGIVSVDGSVRTYLSIGAQLPQRAAMGGEKERADLAAFEALLVSVSREHWSQNCDWNALVT